MNYFFFKEGIKLGVGMVESQGEEKGGNKIKIH